MTLSPDCVKAMTATVTAETTPGVKEIHPSGMTVP